MTDWSTLKKLIWLRIIKGGGSVLRTVTGALIHVTNALALPAEALTVNVSPIQDLHGYDSPWPAGGGKNKLNSGFCLNRTSRGLRTVVNADGSITLTGTAETATRYWNSADNLGLTLAAGTYTLSPSNLRLEKSGGSVYGTFTLSEETTFSNVYWGGFTSGEVVNTIVYPQLEIGSTATAYAPYENICPISGRTSATIYHSGADTSNPTTYTIQLGQTVYGGQLDVTQGKMVVDRVMVDLGTLAWGYESGTAQFYSNGILSTSINWHNWSAVPPLLCSQYKPISNAQLASSDFCVSYAFNTKQLRVKDSTYTDAVTFKTAMSGVQLVYELATPIEITLLPTQIEMLLGENNLWSDAGDSTLTYYAEGEASASEALGILLGGTYNNPGGADDVSDDEALGILLGGS